MLNLNREKLIQIVGVYRRVNEIRLVKYSACCTVFYNFNTRGYIVADGAILYKPALTVASSRLSQFSGRKSIMMSTKFICKFVRYQHSCESELLSHTLTKFQSCQTRTTKIAGPLTAGICHACSDNPSSFLTVMRYGKI